MKDLIALIISYGDALPLAAHVAITLLLGWLLAKLGRLIITGLLTLARLNKIADKTGFSEFLRKGNVAYSPSRLIGMFTYWIIMILVLVRVAALLDPGILTSVGYRLREFLPGLAAALLVMIVGLLGVSFAANLGRTIAQNAAVPNADLVGRAIKGIGYVIIILMALDQAGIRGSILNTITLLFFGALFFGSALAFGLGCKDMAGRAFSRLLQDLRERDRESKGADLEG